MITRTPTKMQPESGTRKSSRPERGGAARRPSRSSNRNLQRYLVEIRRYAVLSQEEEVRLARKVRGGDPEALTRLIEANLRFVVKIANQYRDYGVPVEDLINEGNVGLVEAVQRFDPERGVKLISWAVWWIRKAIRNAITEQPRVVRLPLSQINKIREVRAVERDLQDDLGRAPTTEEISAKLPKASGLKPLHRHGIQVTSLDGPADDENLNTLSASLEDVDTPSVEARMLDEEASDGVGQLFRQLEERQRTVISCRFGLDGEQPLTLEETGQRIGLSRERVRQIELRAIRQLRCRLVARTYRSRLFTGPIRRQARPGEDIDNAA